MKERPLLFSAPMVMALLAGTKTQTRRTVKFNASGRIKSPNSRQNWHPEDPNVGVASPYGIPGKDRLWVKETWATDWIWDDFKPTDIREGAPILYRADESATSIVAFEWGQWRPSLFMRRWMSRITLQIESVRVERLQGISEADALAEGAEIMKQGTDGQWIVCGPAIGSYREGYRWLWEKINGPGSWNANPFVWVINFKRVEVKP